MLFLLLAACHCPDESPFCVAGCKSGDLDLDEPSEDAGWTPQEVIDALTADDYVVDFGMAPDELDGTFRIEWDGGPAVGTDCGNGLGFTIGVKVLREDEGYVGDGSAELAVAEPGDATYRLDVAVSGAWSEDVVATLAEPLPEGSQELGLNGDLVSGSADLQFNTADTSNQYSDGTWVRP